jgi:hypothetical protein
VPDEDHPAVDAADAVTTVGDRTDVDERFGADQAGGAQRGPRRTEPTTGPAKSSSSS